LKKDLDLLDNVHFLYELGKDGLAQRIPDEVIADLFQIADILIFPSQREGFGIPVLEAGLARAAVFAADIPVMRESSRGHASLFNLSADPADVGREIVAYVQTNQSYQLRKVVLSEYSWESIVYNKVIPIIDRAGISS
jgi:glycosyltransferase involved in cell wall biosynthesis